MYMILKCIILVNAEGFGEMPSNQTPSCMLRYNYLQHQIHLELDEHFRRNNNNVISTSTCEEVLPETISSPKPPRGQRTCITVREVADDDEDDGVPIGYQSRRHSSLPSRPAYIDLQEYSQCSDDMDIESGTKRHSSM